MTIAGDEVGSGNKDKSTQQLLLRKVLDETIQSLGGPISKTIMWQMSNKGVFSESTRIDIKAFYLNLKELVGPGADMIMEVTWQKLKKENKGQNNLPRSGTIIDMIMKMIQSDGEMR